MIPIFLNCLLLVSALASEPKFHNQNNIITARCRAQCLIKLVDDPKKDCLDMKECSSCWNLCDDLYNDSEARVWEQVCQSSRCLTGCQESCRFYFTQSINIEATRTDTRFTRPLRYRSNDDALQLSWSCPEGNDRIEPLVYLLAVSDRSRELMLEQTYYRNLTVAWSLLAEFEELRLTAYDSRGKVAELEVPLSDIRPVQWQIELVFMKLLDESKNCDQVEVFIDWRANQAKAEAYEVEWRNMDGAFDVTGHVTTAKNFIALQLKTYSKYEVVVRVSGSANAVPESSILLNTTPSLAKSAQKRISASCIATRISLVVIFMGACYSCLVLIAAMIGPRPKPKTLRKRARAPTDVESQEIKVPPTAEDSDAWKCCVPPKYEVLNEGPSDTAALCPEGVSA